MTTKCLPVLPEDGKYAVGAIDLMLSPRDSTRNEAPNGLFARVFYPVDKSLENEYIQTMPWTPREEYEDLSPYGRIFHGLFGLVVKNATVRLCYGAPLADGHHPIVVFSHGYMVNRYGYTNICSNWAQQGYVVFALEHKDASCTFTYHLMEKENGEFIERQMAHSKLVIERITQHEDTGVTLQIITRSKECLAMLTTIEEINNGVEIKSLVDTEFDWSQFKDKLDMSKAIMTGHSMGSCTTLYTMSMTDKFIVGFALDGFTYPLFEHDGAPFKSLCSNKRPIVLIQCDQTLVEYLNKSRPAKDQRRQLLETGFVTEVVVSESRHGAFNDNCHFSNMLGLRRFVYGKTPAAEFAALVREIQNERIASITEDQVFPSKDFKEKRSTMLSYTDPADLKSTEK